LIVLDQAASAGIATPHDDRYVMEYDPTQRAKGPLGVHLVTTVDPRLARRFRSMDELVAFVNRPMSDLPHAPIRAYTLDVLVLSDALVLAAMTASGAARGNSADLEFCGAEISVDPLTDQPFLCAKVRPCRDHPDRG
jgi:hypothetical protein